MITIDFRILLLKLGCQINAANDIKNQRRRLSRLATVMFRGTTCILYPGLILKQNLEADI